MFILSRWICLGLALIISITAFSASGPLLTLSPITPLPAMIPNNGTTITVIYNVINNSNNNNLTRIPMDTISGVEQVMNTTGACNTTATPQSCLLYLDFHGANTPAVIQDGPFIQTPSSRIRPSSNHILQMQTAAPSTQVDNTWIKVLVAQDPPPSDSTELATYVAKIKKLAPNLEQIHIRVTPQPFDPNSSAYQNYANAVTALRAAYPGTRLIVGFHPDTNKKQDSCQGWGCQNCPADPAQWNITQLTCMMDTSIKTMNAISALLPAGQKFDTYSIEQGYVQPMDTCPLPPGSTAPACLQQMKACLCPQGTSTENGTSCPAVNPQSCISNVTLAFPSVTYGNVLGSYGGQDIYGPTGLDFGYPQFYNLGKKIITDYDSLISGGYFPNASTACHSGPPYVANLYVVDIDSNGAYAPEIPCYIAGQPEQANIYTNPSAAAPDPNLAAAYLAFIMTQYPPIQGGPATVVGAKVYITLSGEGGAPTALGGSGWSLANLWQLNYDLGIKFTQLNALFPALFNQGGTTFTGVQNFEYAIWNFDDILANITLP